MSHNILSLESAAKFLSCSEKELKQLAIAGEIPYFEQGDRLVFPQADLDNWLSANFIGEQNAKRKKHHKIPLDSSILLSDYLSPTGVDLFLAGHSTASILRSLTSLAEQTGLLYNPDDFYKELRAREEIDSTAMDNGVALVHPCNRNDFLIESPFICIGRAETPVFFGNPNGFPTDLFFVIACQESRLHLQMLGGLCQLFAVTTLADDIRQAETPREIPSLFRQAEQIKNNLLLKK